MSKRGSFEISSVEEAATAIEYFNGFHDGFMKRIVITSQDEIDADYGQSCTGAFLVEIEFAHYNFQDGEEPLQPHGQLVHASFRNVQDIFCDFREGFLGNTIIGLSIGSINRRKGGTTTTERCMGLWLTRNYHLEEYRRFELRQSQVFTFTDATFRKLTAGA